MNLPNIIISGHINSGKTTTALYLVEKYGYIKYSLGDGVKSFIVDLYSILNILDPNISKINLEDLYSRDKKEQYRKHMQILSTDLVRKYFGEDVWINYLKHKIELETKQNTNLKCSLEGCDCDKHCDLNKGCNLNEISKSKQPFIIDDIRFKNEYLSFSDAIRIKIIRNNEVSSLHISEHDVDDLNFDYIIENNGNLDDLYKKIDEIMLKQC